jgi:nucleoside-diphosphate-sugar epimerase
MNGRVLITGGAGFIGSRVALRLAREGWEVRVLDALLEQVLGPAPEESATVRALRGGIEVTVGDVRDARACWRALAGCSHVLHLAAETGTGQSTYSTARYADANVLGTATLCDAIARCRATVETVVVASSRARSTAKGVPCAPSMARSTRRRGAMPTCSVGTSSPAARPVAPPSSPCPRPRRRWRHRSRFTA